MSSTCFKPEGSPLRRHMYVQVGYGMFYWDLSIEHTLLPTRLLILMHVNRTIP